MEKDLNEIKLLTGKTAAEYLKTRPKEYRSVETEAIFKCLNQNLPLFDGMIQETARAISRGEKTKVMKKMNSTMSSLQDTLKPPRRSGMQTVSSRRLEK